MALCESQLEALPQSVEREEREHSSEREGLTADTQGRPQGETVRPPSEALFALNQGGLPLTVDYRSPVSHFIPPAVERYNKHKPGPASTESSQSPTPAKRKRGRPRVDKTSPEYLARSAARKRAREMAAALNSSAEGSEKRKRGRPRIDKTSPEYLARKRAKELEALERRANRQYKRRTAGDSAASSSGEAAPRVKRKYTKRNPNGTIGRPRKDPEAPGSERVKGKRGRPRKLDAGAAAAGRPPPPPPPGKIRVRSNLMPSNDEPITLDSDDEPDIGSPSQASDSQISFDENLRAIQHLHEKYANLDRDDAFNADLLAGKAASEGRSTGRELDAAARVEKLEDSSNSDSDSSSSSGSGSSSSSSSSSSSGSSDSSDSSDSEDGEGAPAAKPEDDRSFGAWSHQSGERSGERSGGRSGSESSVERARSVSPTASISESDNESPDKTIQCRVCHKWYSTIVTLKIHRRVHLNRGGAGGAGGAGGVGRARARSAARYPCEQCDLTFSRREKLHEHRASAHRGSMTVRCSLCRACFEHDADLARHELTHTDDEREGRCGECGAVFSRHELLRRHRLAAHTHTHACTTCGKSFHHAHSLTRHLHNHARQLYKCVVCKASFARADQLAQHLNSHLANYKRLKP